jgi:hypothetical protein
MDEFIYVLIAAGVILVLLMAFGTPLVEWMNQEPNATRYEVVSQFSLGEVGYSISEVARTINIGSFTLGKTQSEDLKSFPKIEVSNNLLGSHFEKFDIELGSEILNGLKNIKISFDIAETNLYGNLVVKWNGESVLDTKANLNHYNITIDPEKVKLSNNIEISCSGPGLLFWASTVYSLREFNVKAEYGPEKIQSFDLSLKELDTWEKGVLTFYTTKGQQAELIIKINNDEIYRKQSPEHLETVNITYPEVALKTGKNLIVFGVKNGVLDMDDVKMEIFLLGNQISRERKFNLTTAQYNLVKQKGGQIEFNVAEVLKDGTLKISINDHELNMDVSRTGEFSVYFDQSKISEGENTIEFSGTGGWDIQDVKIEVNK